MASLGISPGYCRRMPGFRSMPPRIRAISAPTSARCGPKKPTGRRTPPEPSATARPSCKSTPIPGTFGSTRDRDRLLQNRKRPFRTSEWALFVVGEVLSFEFRVHQLLDTRYDVVD